MHPVNCRALFASIVAALIPSSILLSQQKERYVPTPDKPLRVTTAAVRAVRAELQRARGLEPDKVTAHPAAASFPGAVSAKAKRVTRTTDIVVKTKTWRARGIYANSSSNVWHSTGLYAPPGGVVTVHLAKELLDLGLQARIGCHSDRLWRKRTWRRIPEITRTWALTRGMTKIASEFGGLIYVEVPIRCQRSKFSVKVSGGVEAPYFVLGKTGLDAWRKSIRNHPAPWAELASDKFILSVPSRVVRKLDDPESLMKLWDQVLDADADLAAWPRDRYRPERFVLDTQISVGYMHSGYPLMGQLDVADVIVSKDRLKKNKHSGIWGLFHELGHNHQSGDWTFSGTTEVTVNLFTLYVYDQVLNNKTPRREILGGARQRKLKRYLDGGARFKTWQRDPFLALITYAQLQEAFGWAPFKKVFAEYGKLSREKKRWSDAEKRDQWMIRFSRTVGRNLGPFFQAWGIPTSKQARASIEKLPKWMPKDFPAAKE